MSIRDDLAAVLLDVDLHGTHDEAEWPQAFADAVLAYLGDLDRDADAELIAWHLRDSRKEIEELRWHDHVLSNTHDILATATGLSQKETDPTEMAVLLWDERDELRAAVNDTRAELERLREQHATLVEVVEERRRIYRQCADLANNFESKAWNDGAATAMTWLLQELSALKKEEAGDA